MGRCHGIASSGQAMEDQGQLFWAAQGTPAVMLSAAQCTGQGPGCCPRRGGHASHTGHSALLPPCLGESHIPGMKQLSAELTRVMLNPSRWLCASQTGVTSAERGTTASEPEAKVRAASSEILVCIQDCPHQSQVTVVLNTSSVL